MTLSEPLAVTFAVIDVLDSLEVRYLLDGSFASSAPDLLKVLTEFTRVNIELCSLWQDGLKVALQFPKLNQARLQHEHDIVEVRLETTRNLAQGDRMRVENKYLYLTEATHEPFAFVCTRG